MDISTTPKKSPASGQSVVVGSRKDEDEDNRSDDEGAPVATRLTVHRPANALTALAHSPPACLPLH